MFHKKGSYFVITKNTMFARSVIENTSAMSKLYTKLVDLDLSLARTSAKNGYDLRGAKPIRKNVQLVKKWRDEGYRIVIYTARDWWQEEQIAGWLISNGIPFTRIICGKPVGEIWDDRAFNINCSECLSHA